MSMCLIPLPPSCIEHMNNGIQSCPYCEFARAFYSVDGYGKPLPLPDKDEQNRLHRNLSAYNEEINT